MIASLTLNKVNKINIIPSRKTAVKANSHDFPIPSTTVNAKNALRPIPGASANGSFAYNPITNVANREDNAVAVKIAPKSIPVSDKINGLTIKIYAIVMNVVTPALTSVDKFVLCLSNSK